MFTNTHAVTVKTHKIGGHPVHEMLDKTPVKDILDSILETLEETVSLFDLKAQDIAAPNDGHSLASMSKRLKPLRQRDSDPDSGFSNPALKEWCDNAHQKS